MSALTITFHAPRITSDFRRTVLNRLVTDSLHTLRIVGSDATPDEVKQVAGFAADGSPAKDGEGIPVMKATDVKTAGLRSHVTLYLKQRGYSVTATPFESSADGAIIGYTLRAVKTDTPQVDRFRK